MYIDQELDIDFRDSGRWRSYSLIASGENLEDMLEDATISEVDQDGGEIMSYGLDEGNEASIVAHELITKLWSKT